MTPPDLYLVAHALDAPGEAYIELEVASQDLDGAWRTNSGERIWPYWTQLIPRPYPLPPPEWLDHLKAEAHCFVSTKPKPKTLLEALGLTRRSQPKLPRRF